MRDASSSWQKILAQGFSSSKELLQFLHLPLDLASKDAEQVFKFKVPRGFANRMKKGDAKDPLLLQVLAQAEELENPQGYTFDPLVEVPASPRQGLLHKYQGRVLLVLTGVCAINCRYCFRRHFPYTEHNPGREGWRQTLDYIREDPSVEEVIFSGGDPLVVSDKVLAFLIAELETIPHLKILRFHSRIPIVLPERITPAFLNILAESSLQKVIVLHSNHAQEFDATVKEACLALRSIGCHLLNQSVLLKGINDELGALVALSRALFDAAVLPYYLHVLDKVAGAAHFDLDLEQALLLYRQLQASLPGYLVPRLAREIPGQQNKTLLI